MDSSYFNIDTAAPATPEVSVLLIYTGGTVGMAYDDDGSLVPMKFASIMGNLPELRQFRMRLTVHSLPTPIDSSNVTPTVWADLVHIITHSYDEYDGFVILHGTDTMAYSASALSFMLENLTKPVIFTGAQLPIGRIRTDARKNLLTALQLASARHKTTEAARIPEVCIYFHNVLLRGNRAKKVESGHFDAFKSENHPPLVRAGIDLEFNDAAIRPLSALPRKFHQHLDERVVILKLFPGISEQAVRGILAIDNLRGCVLETFGSGNAPTASWFTTALREALDRGLHILNVSQCDEGRVQQGRYETSAHLRDLGIIGGDDITTEAAVAKLMFVLGLNQDAPTTRRLLARDLRGEISNWEE
ncbi:MULTISPECIES: asparaginase [Hymenobacter]|nr:MULTISPECIES: asparaginase [Hymenobacter]